MGLKIIEDKIIYMKRILLVVALLSFFYFFPFDWFICGELNEELNGRVSNVKKMYGNLVEIQVIPCEYSEINIKLKTENYSDTLFHAIHKILYDEHNGWSTIVIYNKKGNYLFDHSCTNKFYKR